MHLVASARPFVMLSSLNHWPLSIIFGIVVGLNLVEVGIEGQGYIASRSRSKVSIKIRVKVKVLAHSSRY